MEAPAGVRNTDYAGNFEAFLKAKPEGRPFCFWYGCTEPHRAYEFGAGIKKGGKSIDLQASMNYALKAGQNVKMKAGMNFKTEAGMNMVNKAGMNIQNKAGMMLKSEAGMMLKGKAGLMVDLKTDLTLPV